jgi:transcriptional regulator with XRE-family HTH domain
MAAASADPVVEFGRRVRAVRQAHGWTLEELADLTAGRIWKREEIEAWTK